MTAPAPDGAAPAPPGPTDAASLAATTTEDRLLGGRVVLAQPASGYRVAIDPVLLAAAVEARPGERVADLGCGVGAASLCLMARLPGLAVTGIEIDPAAAALAATNAARNGAGGFAVRRADLLGDPAALAGLGPFDHVMTNPPFHAAAATDPAPDAAKARATVGGALADWLRPATRLLAPRGSLTVICRADRLPELIAALPRDLGGIAILPFWPRAGQPARRVLVQARRGSRAPATVTAGLVLHEADGRWTAAAEAVLRDAAGLAGLVDGFGPHKKGTG